MKGPPVPDTKDTCLRDARIALISGSSELALGCCYRSILHTVQQLRRLNGDDAICRFSKIETYEETCPGEARATPRYLQLANLRIGIYCRGHFIALEPLVYSTKEMDIACWVAGA